MDAIGPMSYCQLNGLLDGGFPKGALNDWKSGFLARLSDDAIDAMIDCFARCPTPMGALLLEHFHGAATRVGGRRHRVSAPRGGRQSARALAMDGSCPNRTVHCMGAQDLHGDGGFMVLGRYDPGNFFHVNQNIRPA